MAKIKFRGDWTDQAEREGMRAVLEAVIPDGQTWTITHPKGDERVVTYDPSQPFEPAQSRPLRKLRADAMRNPPRYVYWNNAADDLRFTATTLLEIVLMVGIFNEVGEQRIRRDMTLFEALPD